MATTHGLRVEIDWHQMPVGSSVFIPCADTRNLKRELKEEADSTGYNTKIEEIVELGICGVRVWRVG